MSIATVSGFSERTRPLVSGIAGSPRRGGNSEFLLDRALAGAEAEGAEIRKVVLSKLKFTPCHNCGFCAEKGVCRFDDDMRIIYENLEEATHFILATPVYFTTVSSQVKAMIDRCQSLWSRRFVLKIKPRRADRRGLLLSVGGFKTDRFLHCTQQVVHTWMRVVGIKPVNTLFYSGVDEKGAAEKHPIAGQECFDAGRALVRG